MNVYTCYIMNVQQCHVTLTTPHFGGNLSPFCQINIYASTGWAKNVIPLVQCNVMFERYHFFGPLCMFIYLKDAVGIDKN